MHTKCKHTLNLYFTLSKARRSYSLMACDSTPAANISPSGSKEQTGFPSGLVKPWNTQIITKKKSERLQQEVWIFVEICKSIITIFQPSGQMLIKNTTDFYVAPWCAVIWEVSLKALTAMAAGVITHLSNCLQRTEEVSFSGLLADYSLDSLESAGPRFGSSYPTSLR